MTGAQLISRIGNPYEEPILSVRNHPSWPNLSNPLHVALLLIDFDTELNINSILGFLENSAGAYLEQTIEAFRLVGAAQAATTLGEIRDAMQRHSVSHRQLRSDFENTTQFQVTSFSELHPGQNSFASTVCKLADSLYLYNPSQQSPFSLLEAYLEQHENELLAELDSIVT